jgi:hypothetical protein
MTAMTYQTVLLNEASNDWERLPNAARRSLLIFLGLSEAYADVHFHQLPAKERDAIITDYHNEQISRGIL